MNRGMLGKVIAVLIAAAVILSFAFGFLAELVTQIACGARPTPEHLFAGLGLAITGDDSAYVAPSPCAMPVMAIRIVDAAAVILIVAAAVWILIAVRRYRESDSAFLTDLRTRPGFATSSEIRDHLSARAVLRRAKQLRPDLAHPKATDVGWRVGRARGCEAVAQRARRREREASIGLCRRTLAFREVLVEEQALRIDGDPMALDAPPDCEIELRLVD